MLTIKAIRFHYGIMTLPQKVDPSYMLQFVVKFPERSKIMGNNATRIAKERGLSENYPGKLIFIESPTMALY